VRIGHVDSDVDPGKCMTFLNQGGKEMINGKYTQLRLARQFGGINTIGFTHTLSEMPKPAEREFYMYIDIKEIKE